MLTTARFKSSSIVKTLRKLKVFQFSAKSAYECAPFGDDSNPIENMTAIMGKTTESGESVIIGYLNTNQIASVGEKRIFALKENGTLSIDIHLKNDGTLEIAGNSSNAVKYQELKNGLDNYNSSITQELTKIQTALTSVGGVYTPGNLNIDIDSAKSDKVKLS